MSKKQITREKIIHSFLSSASEKSPGATSLADISEVLDIKKASLYNHFASREEMYNATLELCSSEILNSSFISRSTIESAADKKTQPVAVFKKVITAYFKLFESDPFIKMYVFVHSEQYFNKQAMDIVLADYKRLSDGIYSLLKAFKDAGKLPASVKDLRETANIISALTGSQLDKFIAQKQEVIRLNPDTGAGSLFALPTDENMLNRCLKPVETLLKTIFES